MRAVDMIWAKREGQTLPPDALEQLIGDYVAGDVPDYQLSALLMAIFFRGMESEELGALTRAMMNSGETFDLSDIEGPKADKHSTGGVGDKVSILLAPLAAACGLIVPMVSGRGLGHTGGTLDKLESIPGFSVAQDSAQFKAQLRAIGVSMIGQTEGFVPADRKLYALRDVTATVESIPLISASIMSKKLAEGCEVLVLDVKTGPGAFMDQIEGARELARTMIGAGKAMGRKVSALVTDMSQPLGVAVGNANEIAESIRALRGDGCPDDLWAVTEALTGEMLIGGGLAESAEAAGAQVREARDSGRALEVLRQMIEAQGGDPSVVDDPDGKLPDAPHTVEIGAARAGVVQSVACREVGLACVELGGGRATKDDTIDPGVGIEWLARIGQPVEAGQPLFRVRWRDEGRLARARQRLESAVTVGDAGEPPVLLKERID